MHCEPHRVASLAELDSLVGTHITGETPESYWEDSHSLFQFADEIEARQALSDPYYQQFLPAVEWSQTVVRQVRVYRAYSADSAATWLLVGMMSQGSGPLFIWRTDGRWHAAFGSHEDADARTPSVAICLAALRAKGIDIDVNHDRLDAQIAQLGEAPEKTE